MPRRRCGLPHLPRSLVRFMQAPAGMTYRRRYRTVAGRCGLTVFIVVLFLGIAHPAAAQAVLDPAPLPGPSDAKPAKVDDKNLDDLLNMAEKDIGKLADVRVDSSANAPNSSINSPNDTLSSKDTDFSKATSTGDLLKQIPNVSGRRLSGINVDPRVRGYNSSELNASANGMTQRRSIQDIDSLLSQIDPGVIQEITVIDGPYTSLYGPGFAFITADLFAPKRYDRPELQSSTYFNYGSNGQILYGRENVMGGGTRLGRLLQLRRAGRRRLSGRRRLQFSRPLQFPEMGRHAFLEPRSQFLLPNRVRHAPHRNEQRGNARHRLRLKQLDEQSVQPPLHNPGRSRRSAATPGAVVA